MSMQACHSCLNSPAEALESAKEEPLHAAPPNPDINFVIKYIHGLLGFLLMFTRSLMIRAAAIPLPVRYIILTRGLRYLLSA